MQFLSSLNLETVMSHVEQYDLCPPIVKLTCGGFYRHRGLLEFRVIQDPWNIIAWQLAFGQSRSSHGIIPYHLMGLR